MPGGKQKVDTLKEIFYVKTDEELAQKLGVGLFAVRSWKQRDSLPKKYELILVKENYSSEYEQELIEHMKANNPNREYKNIDDIKRRLGIASDIQLAKLFRMDVSEIFIMQKKETKIPEDMQQAARVMEYELYKLKMNFGGMDMDENWGYINFNNKHMQIVGDKLELMAKLMLYANQEFVDQVLARLNEIEKLSKI